MMDKELLLEANGEVGADFLGVSTPAVT